MRLLLEGVVERSAFEWNKVSCGDVLVPDRQVYPIYCAALQPLY